MTEGPLWAPRRRLRHVKQVAFRCIPPLHEGHDALKLALFSLPPIPQHSPPVLLHASTQGSDISPVFSSIEQAICVVSQHSTRHQMWERSAFRLVLLSHDSTEDHQPSALNGATSAPRCLGKCRVCAEHVPFFPGGRPRCDNASCKSWVKERAPHGLPVHWCCTVHDSGRIPVNCMQDLALDSYGSSSQYTCHQKRHSPDADAASLAGLRGPGLATIRESRCLSDKQLPAPCPGSALSRHPSVQRPEQKHVSVSLEVLMSHVQLQLAVITVPMQQEANCDDSGAPSALEEAQLPRGTIPVGGEASRICHWQLQINENSSAMVLVDTVIDLNDNVTAVPHSFSRTLACHACPAKCVMLGVCSSPVVVTNQQQQGKLYQQQALLLHPPLTETALQEFLADNQSSKQEWRAHLQSTSNGFTGGLVDAIVNTLFPFPLPPVRQPQARQLPRNTSSSSVREICATGASDCTPCSQQTSGSAFPHRRQRSFDSAPGLHPPTYTTRAQEVGLTRASTALHSVSRGRSTALSTSSASTAGSDTRSTVVSRKHSSVKMAAGQHSMPAMQYVAFAVREVAELVGAKRQVLARAAALKGRVADAVHTCRAALDLEAQVKQLQVKTQQLRLRNDDIARRTTIARQTAAARKQRMLEQQERLQQACGSGGPLAACLQQAKEQRLCYPDLLHTWRHTHGLLVTRRHQLVISLFHHFRLQPQAVVRYAGGVLNEMQDLWMHQKLLRDPCRRHNRTRSWNSSAPGHSRSSGTNITSAAPIAGGPTSTADPGLQIHTHCEDGLVSKLTPVMTIMGLQCAPDVARRAQLGELGWETSSALQLDHMNTAYGYIAQVVVFLGHVLDVPPLYQLELEGSYCRVQQYMPRTLRPAGAEPDLYEEEHGHALRLTEQPLYVDQGKHDKLKKFAWGCFLLGADVQQLLHEHGITPYGQQFLLENLEKLVAAARISGLKPGL